MGPRKHTVFHLFFIGTGTHTQQNPLAILEFVWGKWCVFCFVLVYYGFAHSHQLYSTILSVNQQLMESIMDGVVSRRLQVNGVPTSLKDLGYRFVTIPPYIFTNPLLFLLTPPNIHFSSSSSQ